MFKHIFLLVTLILSLSRLRVHVGPAKFGSQTAVWEGSCLPSESLFYPGLVTLLQ